MLIHVLLALGGVSVTYAHTTAGSPFLAQWLILSDYTVSTVTGDKTHTTYNVKCDSEASLCSLPAAGVTVVTAPSYVGLSYTDPSETLTSSVGCTYIDARASAVCVTLQGAPSVAVQSGSFVTGIDHITSTFTLPGASVELGFNTAEATNTASRKTDENTSKTTAASHSEAATKTSAIMSATKTGVAGKAFAQGGSGLILGAAIAGLALL